VTTARAMLLASLGEEEFARHIKHLARRYGWHGRHVRYSLGVVEGVHTIRVDGHSDAHGALDWEFCHDDPSAPLLRVELKTASGRLTPDQKRELGLVDGRVVRAQVWRPTDEELIVNTFRRKAGEDAMGQIRG
jgi:hypothetical protein